MILLLLARASLSLAAQECGQVWEPAQVPSGFGVASLYWDGQRFLAGCDSRNFLESQDGMAWTALTDNSWLGGRLITGLACGKREYVACEQDGRILVSKDAQKWRVTEVIQPIREGLGEIAFGKGKFLIVKWGRSLLYASDNGQDWEPVIVKKRKSYDRGFVDIAFDGQKFMIVGGRIGISPTGLNWKTANVPADMFLRAVTPGPSGWVAVGEHGRATGTYNITPVQNDI